VNAEKYGYHYALYQDQQAFAAYKALYEHVQEYGKSGARPVRMLRMREIVYLQQPEEPRMPCIVGVLVVSIDHCPGHFPQPLLFYGKPSHTLHLDISNNSAGWI